MRVLSGATEAAAMTVLSDTQVVATAANQLTYTSITGGGTTGPPRRSSGWLSTRPATAQQSRLTSLAVTFGGAVEAAPVAFTLTRQSDGAAVGSGRTSPRWPCP